MKKDSNLKSYTANDLKTMSNRTDWPKVDAMTDAELESLIASDEDEADLQPDWTQAVLVIPKAKQSVHLRLEKEVIDFFRSAGKGHLGRMQAVLKAYAEAHRQDRH